MPFTSRRAGPAAVGFLALLALHATEPRAQDRIQGTVLKGVAAVKIAIPDPVADANAADAAREIAETLRDDLAYSGYFNVVDARLYSLVAAAVDGGVRHDDWIAIGADEVTRMVLRIEGDRVDLEVWLYNNASKTNLLARRYGGSMALLRPIAHRVANELMRQYTGSDGVARTRIAFVSTHGEGKEIYLMDYDGRRIRRLTTTGTINLSPVWSPPGDELAFVSWRGKQPGVYVMSAEGVLGHLSTVGGDLSISPDWSPDGRKLAYSSDIDGNSEIYVLDRTNGRNTRLTRHPGIDTAPDFSHTGREIAFTSDRTGNPQIYVMDAEGLNVRRLTWRGDYNESAAWSPGGDRLAYVSRIDGRFEIMVLDVASEKLTQLTRGRGNNENPSWSPDGRHLVFSSNRAGSYDIYTIHADGTNRRRLTRNGNCFTPDWSR